MTVKTKVDDINSEELASKRNEYYDKWHTFTKESVAEVEREEETETEKSKEKLGLNGPLSKAEEEDTKKRAALKEAKKQWDKTRASEAAKKAVFGEDMKSGILKVTKDKLGEKRVVVFKGASDSELVLPALEDLSRIVKVFVEDCVNCKIHLEALTVSQHIEVSHCEDCIIYLKAPSKILQVDLCKGLEFDYGQNVFEHGDTKIYSAGANFKVKIFEKDSTETHSHEVDYIKLGAKSKGEKTKEEFQFITLWKNGKLTTEELYRSKGNLPLTKDELIKAKNENLDDGLQHDERAAEVKKTGGNEAFQDKNYAQACIYYTEAIDLAEKNSPLLPICYSNRSFANSKLGRLPEALEDAEKAIEADPKYVKGYFRAGLALHALGRYRDACINLSKASDMEPKNKQIKDALLFAERGVQKQAAGVA